MPLTWVVAPGILTQISSTAYTGGTKSQNLVPGARLICVKYELDKEHLFPSWYDIDHPTVYLLACW